ncbi:SigE family RNA polymerase sigma factor [Streptacidiphilus rugosus]|uniref:SigE family RNA polymerase sigma factor n=1 Tax=Streptacidiphilus rugosus TaxID=405783 RepID=UPI00056A6769|nr:SigE family RNA polymerase sigma factor [Streptacidiphilus rugosus]
MRRRDEEEFLAFAAARSGPLFRSACVLCSGDVHLAEDLVQETLGRMYATWRKISQIDNPAAYAQTVLVRTFLTHRRRRSSTERPTDTLPDEREAEEQDTSLRLTLLDAMGRLAPQDRAVLLLRYWEDRSVEETAEILQIRPGAVRNRSMRALGRVRDLLGHDIAELAYH